jgi:hypothetical protein
MSAVDISLLIYVKLFSGSLDFPVAADGSKITLEAGHMFTFDSSGKTTGPTPFKQE